MLHPSSFPARRDQLAAQAAARFAEDSTVTALRHLPDAIYGSVDDVWDALQAEGGSHPVGELFGEPADWSGETEPDDRRPDPGDGDETARDVATERLTPPAEEAAIHVEKG